MKFPSPQRNRFGVNLGACLAAGLLLSCSQEREEARGEGGAPGPIVAKPSDTTAETEQVPAAVAVTEPDLGAAAVAGPTGEQADPFKPGLAVRKPPVVARNLNPAPGGGPYSTAHWPAPDAASGDPMVIEFLDSGSAARRIEIIKENATAGNQSLAPILRRALLGGSEEVRREAIRSAAGLDGADAADILGAAANDAVPELAEAAVEVAGELDEGTRLNVYTNSLRSQHASVRLAAVEEIVNLRPKYSIDFVFPQLEDPDPAVRQGTADLLEVLFDQRFETAMSAEVWWARDAQNYDEHLNFAGPAGE